MKSLTSWVMFVLVMVLVSMLPRPARAAYLRPGFDAVSGGFLFPLSGNLDRAQAAFIVPAIVHRAQDGYLLLPGVDWNLLDIGYAGPVAGDTNFLHGSLAAGPSVHLGEPIKASLRWACRGLIPGWDESDRFGALKAAFAPENGTLYLNAGVSGVLNLASKETGVMGALTLNKKFGGP